jgi:hypothetical protein
MELGLSTKVRLTGLLRVHESYVSVNEHTSEAALSNVANDSKDNNTEDRMGEKDVTQSE